MSALNAEFIDIQKVDLCFSKNRGTNPSLDQVPSSCFIIIIIVVSHIAGGIKNIYKAHFLFSQSASFVCFLDSSRILA